MSKRDEAVRMLQDALDNAGDREFSATRLEVERIVDLIIEATMEEVAEKMQAALRVARPSGFDL